MASSINKHASAASAGAALLGAAVAVWAGLPVFLVRVGSRDRKPCLLLLV